MAPFFAPQRSAIVPVKRPASTPAVLGQGGIPGRKGKRRLVALIPRPQCGPPIVFQRFRACGGRFCQTRRGRQQLPDVAPVAVAAFVFATEGAAAGVLAALDCAGAAAEVGGAALGAAAGAADEPLPANAARPVPTIKAEAEGRLADWLQ